jgi:RNA polymerase sigma-70 factor, ECF subfamily
MDARDTVDRIGAVVESHSPDLLAFFLRRVETAEDAADLLGEALLVIWRRAASIPTEDEEVRMWMFGIARNLLSTHGRTTRRRSALQDKLRGQLREQVAATAGDSLDVRALLSRLNETDQEIIRLTYWDGFTQKQAAQMLGMPEGTLRSRHHRARESLRRMLVDAGLPSPG